MWEIVLLKSLTVLERYGSKLESIEKEFGKDKGHFEYLVEYVPDDIAKEAHSLLMSSKEIFEAEQYISNEDGKTYSIFKMDNQDGRPDFKELTLSIDRYDGPSHGQTQIVSLRHYAYNDGSEFTNDNYDEIDVDWR